MVADEFLCLQTTDFVADAREYMQKGEKRHCRVINVDVGKRKIGLSLLEAGVKRSSPQRSENSDGGPPRNTNGRRLQRSNSRTSEVQTEVNIKQEK